MATTKIVFFFFLICFVQVRVIKTTKFNTSITLNLERKFPHNTVDISQLYMHDTVRNVRVEIPQFGVGGHANGLIAGLYFASVKFGTPPKEYHLQIDTGSSLTWISCIGCIGCPTESLLEALHYFDPENSTTASSINCKKRACTTVHKNVGGKCLKSNQCGYHIEYGGGQSYASGYILIDQMTYEAVLENNTQVISSTPTIFGCSTNLVGELATNKRSVDGILGLGRNDISTINQLASTGEIPWVFSECLWSAGIGGGFLIFGEALDRTLTYTPLRPSKDHYVIALTSIALNGQVLPIDPVVLKKGAVIDSGTTLAYLVDDVYNPFSRAVNAIASQAGIPPQLEQDLCYSMPISKMEIFPIVIFNFTGGPSMTLRPRDYLIRGYVSDPNVWCVGIRKSFVQGVNIFGDLVLKDKLIVYDLAANRLGWTDYNCASPVQISHDKSKTHLGGSHSIQCMKTRQIVLLYIISLIFFLE